MKLSKELSIPLYQNLPEEIKAFVEQLAGVLKKNQADLYDDINSKVSSFSDGDQTPSVKNGHLKVFQTANTGATTITDFDDAGEGQIIFIKLDANTTINDGGNFRLTGNITGTSDDILTLIYISGIWYQQGLSVN